MTPQPLNSEPVQGPVEGRGVAEIRADLATCEQLAIVPWPAAARRLLGDVPALLAEVEAAHRFEQSAAAESAGLVNTLNGVAAERDSLRGVVQAVEALVRTARFDPGPAGVRHPETRLPFVYTDDLRAALAAAADAPQPERLTRDDVDNLLCAAYPDQERFSVSDVLDVVMPLLAERVTR